MPSHTSQRILDVRRTIDATRERLRRIHREVLPQARARVDRAEQLTSESFDRELEVEQRLRDR
jgi:hypothetical protein